MSERISVDFTAIKRMKLLRRGRNVTKANIYDACLSPTPQEKKMFQNILMLYTAGRFIKRIFYFLIEKNLYNGFLSSVKLAGENASRWRLLHGQ
jgi:hypothetical protein